MLESFIVRWGYAAVGLGVFCEGETIVLIAGAMAHRGLLALWGVVLSALLGSVIGDQVWFLLGRRYGKGFIARRPKWQRRAARAEKLLGRFGIWFVLGFRFIYGFRTVSPVVLGAIGYPVRRFILLNALSAVVWATTVSAAGYAVGATLSGVLGRASRVEELAAGALVVALLLWILSRRFTRRVSGPGTEPAPVAQRP